MNIFIKILKISTILFAIVLVVYYFADSVRLNKANKRFVEEVNRIDELNGHKIIIRGVIYFNQDTIKKDTLK